MAEAKVAIIDDRIQVFKHLLQAIKKSQADLDDIHSSTNKIKDPTIGSLGRTSIERTEPDLIKMQEKIQDETLKKVVSEVIKLQKDSRSETTSENRETSINKRKISKNESHDTIELDNSTDQLNGSISQNDSESDFSLDNISADLLNHIQEKQLSYSTNYSAYHDSSPAVGLKAIPINALKRPVFSLPKTELAAKKRKQELRSISIQLNFDLDHHVDLDESTANTEITKQGVDFGQQYVYVDLVEADLPRIETTDFGIQVDMGHITNTKEVADVQHQFPEQNSFMQDLQPEGELDPQPLTLNEAVAEPESSIDIYISDSNNHQVAYHKGEAYKYILIQKDNKKVLSYKERTELINRYIGVTNPENRNHFYSCLIHEGNCPSKDPLTMKVICKARNKKSKPKSFPKNAKNDTFVDPERLYMQLKSCIRSVGEDSKSSFVKYYCKMCLSGNLLSVEVIIC